MEKKFDNYILSGDVGGTNTTLALVGQKESSYAIVKSIKYSSSEITDFSETVLSTIKMVKQEFKIDLKVLSMGVAGPIEGNFCRPTNTNWSIDIKKIEDKTGLKVYMINDFTALCYGVTALDIENPDEIIKFPQPDKRIVPPQGTNIAVMGAGTGLGVGFISKIDNRYIAFPSEGGHFDFPPFDDDSLGLYLWFKEKFKFNPGMERFLSGMGLNYIFEYYQNRLKIENQLTKEIFSTDEKKRAALIAKNSTTDELCKMSHKLFRKIYGKAAGNYAATFMATAGIYIAGGIISKDLPLFLSDDSFMENFSINHNENIRRILKKIPVYIVKNYSTSILGSAIFGFEKSN